MPDAIDSWVQDGTPSAEPVTTETPSAEAVAAAPEPSTQPRDESGRFAAPEAAATETPAAEAPAPGASAEEIAEYIEAQLGEGETFRVPKGIRLPLKVQGQTEYVALDDVLKGGMLERDYRLKTGELSTQRRTFEEERSRFQAEQARLTAREAWVKEQEQMFQEAQRDPDKMAAFDEHLRQYQQNPTYRRMVDDALRMRETEAVNEVYRQREDQALVSRAVETANGWIDQIGADPKYQSVDPGRIRTLYGQQLSAGQASLDPSEIRALFDREADYLSRSVSPLQQQLDALTAKLASLTAANAAERHNETTAHAVDRAKTPRVATTTAAPAPAQAPKVEKFGLRDLPDRISTWANQR